MRMRLFWHFGAVAVLLGTLSARSLAGQQVGTIAGRIVDKGTRQPLGAVQVTLGTTTRGALTQPDGTFRIDNVPVGEVEVRARYIGYGVVARTVTVRAGETVTADLELVSSAVTLDALVVTASGETQAARSMANSVGNVDVAGKAQEQPNSSMAQALTGADPGLSVMQSSGTTGTGSRLRIRGSNSVSLSNEPVIYLDGIRVESGAQSITNGTGVGGQAPSRIDDLNPDDIESCQIIKGPAAAALYGTAAANGILECRTRRGRPGKARWGAYTEYGSLPHFAGWPDNVFGFDTTKSTAIPAQAALRYGCTLTRVSLGQCTQTGGLFRLNPLANDSPFRDGSRSQLGINVSGGGDEMTYYVSGEAEQEDGVYFNNELKRYSLRANLTNRPSDKIEIAVATGYTSSDLQLPDNDNNALGFLGSGLLGSSDTLRQGWGFLVPEESYKIVTRQGVERFTGGATIDARPWSFLNARAVVGVDYTQRLDSRTFPPNQVNFNTTTQQGSRNINPVQLFTYTANFSATARFDLSPSVVSSTTAGSQFFRERAQTIFASGQKLAGGTTSLGGIGIPTVNETNVEAKTFGLFIEEQVAIHNRLFLTAAIRGDDNSAFGKDFDFITYPKVGASWVISEQSFFPAGDLFSSLRLRAAWGASGLQPGTTDALLFFDPVAVTADNTDVVAFQVGNLGNSQLKPERSREVELGFDLGVLRDRMRLEITYYDKLSKDALISRPLAPSLGVTAAQFYNLGQVSNKGIEITFSGRLVEAPNALWDFSLSAWGNKNRLIDLGTDFLGNDIPPIVFGTQRHVEGYPLGAYWVRRYTFNDANADNIITQGEITLAPAFSNVGTPFPTHGATLSTGVTISRRVRLSGLLDYRAGHHLYNLTGDFRCRSNLCPEMTDPATPLQQQADAVAAVFLGQPFAYIEKADFVKLREVALTFFAPTAWAARFGGTSLSLTLAGRNLFTWTDYSGFDPEVNQNAQVNFTTSDFLTSPPIQLFTARLNLTF